LHPEPSAGSGRVLAEVFTSAARDPGARTDAFFDPAAQELPAGLLLAAALDDRPITQVYLWLTDPTDDEPAVVLRRHDFPLSAAAVAGVVNAPDKQRGGVYGTAQQIASFLTNRQAVRWVTSAGVADSRRQFSPAEFVRGTGTLYSLSKEGRGSAGPLVTALTVAVTEAAEELAKRSAGGRLAVPMVAVLDEAANVCRWRELPNLYSHYGSRGICVMTILQSWSQGVEVWGRDGMRKLWSAANVKVYGGGVSEVEFLSELSQLIGDFDLDSVSVSHGRGGRSTNHSTRRERVLDVADLAALPKGRAIVLASGAPATLVRTLPWMTGPHADAVTASIRANDPVSDATLTEAMSSAAAASALEPYPAGARR
jgi:type IV secretory pathway TraG/TraD family ATPase VirD4